MSKNIKPDIEEYFSFEHDGVTHVLPLKTKAVMTPGWVRLNRRLDATDYFMTLLEALCGMSDDDLGLDEEGKVIGDEIMALLDGLSWPEHQVIQQSLAKHLDATLGE